MLGCCWCRKIGVACDLGHNFVSVDFRGPGVFGVETGSMKWDLQKGAQFPEGEGESSSSNSDSAHQIVVSAHELKAVEELSA